MMFSLKWYRAFFATIFFVAMTAFFLGLTDLLPIYDVQTTGEHEAGLRPTAWHVLAHFQLVPALLAGSVAMLVFWTVLTMLFGRVYCSFICPLGILQDGISRFGKTLQGKQGKYHFRPAMTRTRWTFLLLFVGALPFLPIVVSLLDPYAQFGRIATVLFRPVVDVLNNLFAQYLPEVAGLRFSYLSNPIDHAALFVVLLTLGLVGALALCFGRLYCNMICPVGTFLGVLSRLSVFKIRLKSHCVSCGLCEQRCKGECIDSKSKTVDTSRCVACFNCLKTCRRNSLVYSIPLRWMPSTTMVQPEISATHSKRVAVDSDRGRRSFLQWTCLAFVAPTIGGATRDLAAAPPHDASLPKGSSRVADHWPLTTGHDDASLSKGSSRVGYARTEPILPPGATDRKRFQKRCTACHLCVAKCPAKAIRPSTLELGLAGFLQPIVRFDHGFCNYDCTICTEVCPSHALTRKTKAEKHLLQIGRVVFLQENCVVENQGTSCGACAEHCPTGAVTMVPHGDPAKALTMPVINAELCVGCGACEYICPVRPYRAIYVDGLAVHGTAEPAYDPDAKQQEVKLDDFGF